MTFNSEFLVTTLLIIPMFDQLSYQKFEDYSHGDCESPACQVLFIMVLSFPFYFSIIAISIINKITNSSRVLPTSRVFYAASFIIQLSYTVPIQIFWWADLYPVILGCDETTTLTSLSLCNSRGVNSTHHCHYTMDSADSNFNECFCSVFNLNNNSVNALIVRELTGFICTRSQTMN